MASSAKILSELLKQYEPRVAAAFLKAMSDWRNSMDIAAFIRALSNNNIAAAITALHLSPAELQDFLNQLQTAYGNAGIQTAAAFPKLTSPTTGAKFIVRFNGRDSIAEAWLRGKSSDLITNITNAQRDAIQIMLRVGLELGDNPTTTALDIVGRIGAKGKRVGGVIGLNKPQADALASAKRELYSADSGMLRNYLTRSLRDKRFDSTVQKAIETGKKVEAGARTKMLTAYSNSLLRLRGETIARTETLAALHAGQYEAVRQAAENGGISPLNINKTWRSAHDRKVRHTHTILNGKTVKYDRPFVSSSGARMMHPGDTSLGAGPGEIINCRCIAPVKVNFLGGLK